jgi:hypothetical protein
MKEAIMAEKTVDPKDWSIFQLIFKKGNMLHTMHFKCPDLNNAVAKGRKYCEKKSLRFINVCEWLKDIDQMISFEPDDNWLGGSK